MALDGGDLGRLMLQGVEAVLVADEHLQRRQDRDHAEPHAHHGLCFFGEAALDK